MEHRTLEELALLEDIKDIKNKYLDLINEYERRVKIAHENGDTDNEIRNLIRINILWTVIFDLYDYNLLP